MYMPYVQGAPIALRMAKAAINKGMDVDLQTAYALEHSYYAQVSISATAISISTLAAYAHEPLPGQWETSTVYHNTINASSWVSSLPDLPCRGLPAQQALFELFACGMQVIPTQDRLEGLRAFKEKRQPQFQGV